MQDSGYYEVGLADHAVDAMLLAATEAYYLGRPEGRRRRRRRFVEVDGYLWGYRVRKPDGSTYIFVDRFAPSVGSERSPGAVKPNWGAAPLMNAIMEARAPQMTFLGSLHTHPFDSVVTAQRRKGWRFSDGDRSCWSELVDGESGFDELYGSEAALWLVVAVAPLKRVQFQPFAKPVGNTLNVWRFDVGELRFWVNAELVRPDEDGVATKTEEVVLDMFSQYANVAGPIGTSAATRGH